ncbi:MAG: DEAD/DEAH box helicase family protein, partial [Candidatus Poribacteria bacterium]|nr:DEAD/DEAH box helicase family protein [Candidatus Poribacteria bacterium]
MSQATQMPLFIGDEESDNGFYDALNYIRQNANSQFGKGRLFERLVRAYLLEDPFYKKRFSEVYLWAEWAANQPAFTRTDLGIDLVAIERNNGICAIQCKCYAEDKRISKSDIDTFISQSNRQPFTARIFVDTGKSWSKNLLKAIDGLEPPCQRISSAHLASRPVQWPDLSQQEPDQLNYQLETYSLRDHQKEAFDDIINGFKDSDRGKMIMACGTGKTFTALRIAEEIAGVGGRVLYLVPSIGLFAQAMREWAEQQDIPHRYIGICSDTKAGKANEDATLMELEFPVTTDETVISEALQKIDAENMQVVFCTYHSLPKVEEAQNAGAPAFDIIFCDEGHRTTGVDKLEDKTSPFVLVHDNDRIRANKRLYMTATPRLYTESAKTKAAKHSIDVYSMDNPNIYGPEFHHLTFSTAVEKDLLSDYRVVVLAMSEQGVQDTLHNYLSNGGSEVNINDATKIVGCWRALQNPERKSPDDDSITPLTRAIAFTNTIKTSQNLVEHWNGIIDSAIEKMSEEQRPQNFTCETAHVDGKNNALERKRLIEWLKGNSEGVCRILSNARCLSEGIDVPALDAVLFMTPRNSHVDIVQAVGRVMRKAPNKTYGYIILPVAIPTGVDPVEALNDNERFAAVWGVLRALRSHDDRLNAEINKIDLNTEPTEIIIIEEGNGDGEYREGTLDHEQLQLPIGIPADAIYAKIVEKCGDRKYWESWAKDVADIFKRLVGRIENLLEDPENSALQEWFDDFHKELMETINDSITRENVIDMMAQHIITRPVFEALFENYNFASGNPVAIALDSLRNDFGEFGLENETRDLEGFYESVQNRARGLDNSEARQRVLLELYEKFFVTALKKEVERLGIVYTPIEVVDFILHSANEVLQDEFGRSLSDEGVHVLDPFTGTGVFLTRLLQSDIIQDADLERKYREELHANEIVLLAYYIATVNIEETFRGRRGEDSSYEPFNGIVLTDTFNLNTGRGLFPKEWLPENNERAERQQKLPIQVIVGNPPWSAGQRSAADDNPNVEYPELEDRIRETYVEYSTMTNKNTLYDTYKMAIRWASDRIEKQGIVAFVTNGSWVDGNTDAGIRACLAEEFSSIHVLHLRGDARTSGERRRAEAGNVFG